MTGPLLEAKGLAAGYEGRPVVHDLDLSVGAGEVVALLGPNGAGKTTTLLTMAGELDPIEGEVLIDGEAVKSPLHARARRGLGYITEERSVFTGLTARENLWCGGVPIERALALFPELERVLDTRGGLLSGGEQQMLTLARALGRGPRLLLADELSLGLAPLVVDRLLKAVRAAADAGTAVLVVEQYARKALEYADRAYVMAGGRIRMAVSASEGRQRLSDIEATYFSAAPQDDLNEAVAADKAEPASPDQNRTER